MVNVQVDRVLGFKDKVGGGAVRDHRAGRLWWVEVPAGLIRMLSPTSGTTDSIGRFWAGTILEGSSDSPHGRFHHLDSDGSVTPRIDGVFTTNGLAFSPEGRTMYCPDSSSKVRTVWAADYDTDTGAPGNPHVFFDTKSLAGRPDGGTVDARGCYWIAGVSGWQLYRVTPDGRLDTTIDMPIEKPTKPMFGGTNLDTLYLTSIGSSLTQAACLRSPVWPSAACLKPVSKAKP